jgi:cell division protein FtsB
MFGLTKREQRWKAEQQAAELLVGLAQTVVQANAEIRIAEANAELERLRKENAELRAARALSADQQEQSRGTAGMGEVPRD